MKSKIIILAILGVIIANTAIAQNNKGKFGIELNGNVSVYSSKLHESSLNTGLGFEVLGSYRFMPYTSVYGGWGFNHFSAEESFAGPDMDFEQTGYILGLQLNYPLEKTPVSLFLRAGMLYSHIETENKDGMIISDTGHGVGYQIATGFEVDMGKKWSVAPGLKFNSLSGETLIEGTNYQLEHRFISARVGIIKRF